MSSINFNPAVSRRSLIMGLAGLGAAGVLAGCNSDNAGSGSTSSSSASGAAFKIGGIGPTTGATAIYGSACKNAIQIAVDEINDKGGDIQFELNFQDDENDAEKSVNAYNNLKDWGMQILVGTTTTAPCVAVSSETNSDNMFQLTPSASSTDVIGGQPDADGNISTPRKDNVFQMCFTDPNQGKAAADYIADHQLGTAIGIIYDSSDAYSSGIYQAFVAEAQSKGLNIVAQPSFTADNKSDLSTQVAQCQDAGADLVFLPIYYQEASQVLVAANRTGYTPTFFGCDGMDGILDVEGFDTSLANGLMMLCPFSAYGEDETTVTFVTNYKAAFNDEVPNQFAADAYDCVYAIYQCVQDGVITPDMSVSDMCEALKGAFTTMTFSGTTGEGQTWDENGMISKEPKVYIIQDGAYVLAEGETA